ncbi:MAG: hypothetical protein AAGC88_15220, partial [Bacteroidota bacterium]
MKTLFWIIALIFHFHFIAAQSSTLKVVIEDLPAENGKVMIAIYDSKDSFLSKKVVAGVKVDCFSPFCQTEFQ